LLRDYASDLEAVIETLGSDEPIVIIASSMGGAIAVHFTSMHRTSIAGVVLLDPFHPSHNSRVLSLNNKIRYQDNNALSLFMSELQQELDCAGEANNPDAMDMKKAVCEAQETWGLGSIPLRVFSAGRTSFENDFPAQFISDYEATWMDLQKSFVSLSQDTEWQVLPNVGHNIHEEAHMLVVQATTRLINS
jgi:pimeloyl-ACP methyl ester carboxylesterase